MLVDGPLILQVIALFAIVITMMIVFTCIICKTVGTIGNEAILFTLGGLGIMIVVFAICSLIYDPIGSWQAFINYGYTDKG